jgi:hypothetical protein
MRKNLQGVKGRIKASDYLIQDREVWLKIEISANHLMLNKTLIKMMRKIWMKIAILKLWK